MEIDVPARAALTLDDATAAAHGRRMGARFALVAAAKGGPGAPVEISLVDTGSGARRDSALVPTTGEVGQIDAAVMRLDEEARRVTLEQQTAGGGAPPPPVAAEPTAGSMGPPLLLTPAPSQGELPRRSGRLGPRPLAAPDRHRRRRRDGHRPQRGRLQR